MTHYPFPDSRGTKIAFAAFFTAMLFLARDSMFTTAVIGFEKAQFLMLGVICLLGGLQLFSIGILGQYLSKTYLEVKHRPIYIIKESNTAESYK